MAELSGGPDFAGPDTTLAGRRTWLRGQCRGRPAVVCEPGLGASSVGWSQVRDDLAATTLVVTYDRSGLGASPARPCGRGVRALTEDLAHTIEVACQGAPTVVVGHSLGATVARHLAATRPDLVAGLVLIDPVPDRWVLHHARWAAPIGETAYLALAALARLGLLDATTRLPLFRKLIRSSTSPLAALTDGDRELLAEEMRRPGSHHAARREFSGLLASRAELRAMRANPSITVPLTVISGGRTHWLTSRLRRSATAWHMGLVERSPDARHIDVHDGCHCIPRYQPDLVTAATVELLGRVHARRARNVKCGNESTLRRPACCPAADGGRPHHPVTDH
jgi:pimeloyl-ACP methyl ester carboxylesterase